MATQLQNFNKQPIYPITLMSAIPGLESTLAQKQSKNLSISLQSTTETQIEPVLDDFAANVLALDILLGSGVVL